VLSRAISPNASGVDATATASVNIPLLALEKAWSMTADQTRILRLNVVGAIYPSGLSFTGPVRHRNAFEKQCRCRSDVIICTLHLSLRRTIITEENEIQYDCRQHRYDDRDDNS
jgi:hypothetical protein